jgi:hypothetical protein
MLGARRTGVVVTHREHDLVAGRGTIQRGGGDEERGATALEALAVAELPAEHDGIAREVVARERRRALADTLEEHVGAGPGGETRVVVGLSVAATDGSVDLGADLGARAAEALPVVEAAAALGAVLTVLVR